MQARDTDVDDQLGGPSQIRGRELRLLGHGQIGGSGRQDDNQSATRCWRIRRPGQQTCLLIIKGAGELGQDGCGMLLARSSEQRHVRLITNSGGDHGNLFRSLACAIDRLRVAASLGPVVIKVGERSTDGSEIALIQS